MNSNVLVLNSNWIPVNIVPVLEAVSKVFKKRAKFLDTETYATFDFPEWVVNWDDAIKAAKIESDKVISSARYDFLMPEIIICTEYGGFGYKNTTRKPKFSRTNIYRRDRNQCQLCGKKFPTEELSLDHITPKSKGGLMSWLNIVLACTSCNNKKGNKTLQEAKMKLVRKPFVPTVDDLKRSPMERLMNKVGRNPPKTWEAFLGKTTFDKTMSTMYWSVELKD